MSEENNVCAICGGLKGPVTREFLDHLLRSAPYTNPLFFRACTCKPEPAQKHDGKLDEQGNRRVRIMGDDGEEFRGKRDVLIANGKLDDGIVLKPNQFLSLMDWGDQNRDELQRLAKEQEQ